MTSSSLSLPYPLYCIAHRGGSQRHTENTLGAFKESMELGVDAIELDVWNVGGQLFVTHDRRLGNTLPGYGRLVEQHPEALKELTLACGNKLASLAEVLSLLADRVMLNIELKGPGTALPVAQLLQQHIHDHHLSAEQYLISSFDHQQLYQFKQRLPDIKRGVLISGIPLDFAASAEALQAYSFHPSLDFVNNELVADAKKRGLKVWVYTVNEEDDLRLMCDLGVEGVFTDYPAKLIQLNRRAYPI